MKKCYVIFLFIIIGVQTHSQFQLNGRFKVEAKDIRDTSNCWFIIKQNIIGANKVFKTLKVRDPNSDFSFSFDSLPKGRYTLIIQEGFVYALFIENINLEGNFRYRMLQNEFKGLLHHWEQWRQRDFTQE